MDMPPWWTDRDIVRAGVASPPCTATRGQSWRGGSAGGLISYSVVAGLPPRLACRFFFRKLCTVFDSSRRNLKPLSPVPFSWPAMDFGGGGPYGRWLEGRHGKSVCGYVCVCAYVCAFVRMRARCVMCDV